MLPNFNGFPSRRCVNKNIFTWFVNITLFLLSLSSVAAPSNNLTHHDGSSERTHRVRATFPPPEIEPDIVIGGLFPIHARNVSKNGPPKCGTLNIERGFHRLEAMIFAVDQINRNPNLLPNITLSMSAYDTCDWYTKALEESLEFVMESQSKTICEAGKTPASPASKKNKILAGVVGAASSSVSIQVANLLRLFKLPQISYASTTPDLSDKTKYDFFMRTVPPDNYQARAMVDVVRGLKWTSVFTVHSEGIYGERGIREFSNGAKAANICIAGSYKIEGSNNEMQIKDIITDFGRHEQVRGVILFCTDTDARRLLREVKRQNRAQHFIWVASDYWGTRKKTIKGLEKYAEGAITISLTEALDPKFKNYFTSLKPGTNRTKVNPWFDEFWEMKFGCRLQNNESSCSKNYSLAASDVRIDDKVPFLIDAVYAFAYGLDKMYKRMCEAQNGLCQRMLKEFERKNLRDELFNLTFTGVTGAVSFDKNGNGPGRYDIYRLERSRYRKVASWNGKLYNATRLFQGGKNGTIPLSDCSSPCEAGYRKIFDKEGSCCWNCERCAEDYYVEDETICKLCQKGQRPNAKRNGCEPLPRRNIAGSWIVMVMLFSGLGIMSTIFVGTLFLINNDTPLVKASGRELSCTLLFGLLSCYTFSFFMLAEPSPSICAIQRFGLGFSFCVCYASILIRTNRIARIFERSNRSTKPPLFINPASQIAILTVFVSIDIVFSVIGLVKWPPETILAYPTNKDVLLICNIEDYDLVFALTYNVLIIILCTFYAFRTRKTPANFNEARYIGFAMYTTCIIWVAFLPVQIGVNKDYATITLAINTTLNATTLLLCIFGPKVYILVFRPTRNLRSRSLNSWRAHDAKNVPNTQGRLQSDNQVTDPSVKSAVTELGIDNLTIPNEFAQGEAAL